MMKKILFIILFALITIGVSAQKNERKAVRSGNKAYKDQLYGAAQADYEKAMKVNAGSKEASFNLANTYYKQQKWDEALKEYQHYLTLENEDPQKMGAAWSNMGNTFLKKKANEKQGQMPVPQGQQPEDPQQGKQEADNLKMSMEAYKNALRLNPTDDATRYNLAVVQKMIKDQEDENKDKDKDKNKDNKDKDQKKDQNKDQNKDQDNKDKNQDKKDQENQMSQDNIQQILQAIEQDEKETQERVKQAKAQERKQKNQNNRKQDKDW